MLLLISTIDASCPRVPGGGASYRTSGDGGFKITISGNPDKYVPQSVYTGTKIIIHQTCNSMRDLNSKFINKISIFV